MEIGKIGMVVIALVIIAFAVAVVALAVPSVGAGLHNFGVNTLGPGIMGTLTSIVTVPLAWGGTTLLYGVIIIAVIIGSWTIVWTLVLKTLWAKAKTKLGYGPQAGSTGQTQVNLPTYSQPQTVIVREVPQPTKEQTATNSS